MRRLTSNIAVLASISGMLMMASSGAAQTRAPMMDSNAVLKYVEDTEMVAQADGLIIALHADEGSTISAGQNLFELDTRLAQAELKVAEKEWEAALAKAKDRSKIEFSELSYQLAMKNLKSYEDLRRKGAASPNEFDRIQLEADKARLGRVVEEVTHKTEQLAAEVSEAKVGAAQVQIDLRQVRAPFDAIIAEKKKQAYDYVRVGEPIVRIVGMSKLHVIGNILAANMTVPPNQLEKASATAIISIFPAVGNTPAKELRVQGFISFVSPVLNSNGEYRVKMEIANVQQDGSWVLREGMPATLLIGDIK